MASTDGWLRDRTTGDPVRRVRVCGIFSPTDSEGFIDTIGSSSTFTDKYTTGTCFPQAVATNWAHVTCLFTSWSMDSFRTLPSSGAREYDRVRCKAVEGHQQFPADDHDEAVLPPIEFDVDTVSYGPVGGRRTGGLSSLALDGG